MKITKKHLFVFTILVLFSLAIIAFSLPVRADNSLVDSQTGLKQIGVTAYGSATPEDIRTTIAKIVNVTLMFIGAIFLGLAVYAGFLYMTASGNEEKTQKALGLLRDAIIGLIVILAAWAITRFTIIILSRTVNGSIDYQTYSPY